MEEKETLSKRERQRLNREKKAESEKKSQTPKKLLYVGLIIVVAVLAFWFMYRGGNSESGQTDQARVQSPAEVTASDNIKFVSSSKDEVLPPQVGSMEYVQESEQALVTLVEYADFQCPACAAYHEILNKLANDFPEDLRIVFRHFPLRSIHRHSQMAAQAAEAAAAQGKFWEYSDLLYANQDDWSVARDPRSTFVKYAESLGLNTDEFDKYMNSSDAKASVDAGFESGMASGLNATPTFFINGEQIANPQGYEPFKALISGLIEQKKQEANEEPESSDSAEIDEAVELTPTL